jgi:NADH-quinone oxidoreductase subunit H
MVIADLNVGILYTFGIVSLGVYGIVLAGYASELEVPVPRRHPLQRADDLLRNRDGHERHPDLPMVGSLNLSDVITYADRHATRLPAELVVFQSMTFLAFCIFLVAAFAETNRLPFDLARSREELVGGYHVEYSSMKFAMFFLGEYAAMIAVSAMMVTLFFGGWTLPFRLDQPATRCSAGLLHIGIFLANSPVPGGVHLGALDVAAVPLRSTDGPGLAAVHSRRAGEHRGHRGCLALVAK